jgi:hypothetical protein
MEAIMQDETYSIERLLSVVIRGQTYLNILYLLLSFPLGIFYFVFLVTGLSVGVSLIIIWVGLPILLVVMVAWWAMARFERRLTISLLRQPMPPLKSRADAPAGLWSRLKAHLANPLTWKSLAYLFVKFPLGILSFVLVVTLLALSVGLLSAPFIYPFVTIGIGGWKVLTFSQALLAAVAGAAIGILSLHALNWLAYISGRFAAVMLSDPTRD